MSFPRNLAVIVAAGVALLIASLATVYYLWRDTGAPEQIDSYPSPIPRRPVVPTPEIEEVTPITAGVDLSTSDEVVRELARGLSNHPKLMAWLANEDLIRRGTAAIESIANGDSPRTNLEFLRPKGKFTVIEKRGDFIIDPACYERYNLIAGFFASLDTEGTVAMYRQLRPLINEAYREIAPPGQSFETALFKAIDQLLKVPIIESDIYLREKVITYTMIDDKLESMSEAQRHLLRMGPQNIRIIQQKLHDLGQELRRRPRPTPTRTAKKARP
jgi:hypothetical protein